MAFGLGLFDGSGNQTFDSNERVMTVWTSGTATISGSTAWNDQLVSTGYSWDGVEDFYIAFKCTSVGAKFSMRAVFSGSDIKISFFNPPVGSHTVSWALLIDPKSKGPSGETHGMATYDSAGNWLWDSGRQTARILRQYSEYWIPSTQNQPSTSSYTRTHGVNDYTIWDDLGYCFWYSSLNTSAGISYTVYVGSTTTYQLATEDFCAGPGNLPGVPDSYYTVNSYDLEI